LVETTMTLVTAYGVYLLADLLQLSAIVAVIVAALVVGNYGRSIGMSERTRMAVDNFWSVLAFLANALIFLLIGAQLNPLSLPSRSGGELASLLIALFAIGVVLLARLILVLFLGPYSLLASPIQRRERKERRQPSFPRSWQLIIFWSGLRGALSLALVLALPAEVPQRSILLISCYAVVFFTLLVQGMSLRWLVIRLPKMHQSDATSLPSAH
jgi:CPA1 family monovalent cation:H+ antiporter